MSKIKKDTFCVYVYLDPRKPGNYVYGDNKEYEFDYEPFYIDKCDNIGIDVHLDEADTNGKWKCTCHKCNKIRKIQRETNTDPIIVRIGTNMTEKIADRCVTKLILEIEREDLKEGPLVNKADV